MQIRYIGHACIAVEMAGKRILCDPWWLGPAYTGQWYPYPIPQPDPGDSEHVDFLYISHGHEDHLHFPTLKAISREATLVIPKFRDPAMRDFLRTLGFRRIVEIGHGQRRQLAPGIRATMYVEKEDSILVLEGEGRTIVNANDALYASARHVVDHYTRQIRARHPRIDMLFLGYAGASWFPNCIQVTDDVGFDAMARERVFTENFAYVARALEPRMAFPIGGAFALLDDRLRWINDTRWRCECPCEELRRQGADHIRTHHMSPGDRIVGDEILASGRHPTHAEEADEELQRHYALQIAELRHHHEPDETRLRRVLETLQENARARAARILEPGQQILARIDVRNVPEASFFVDCTAESISVTRCDRLRLAPMVLSTRLEVLESLATQTYGFESIRIGYGAILQLRRRDLPLRNLLLPLLGRQPLAWTWSERIARWLRSPLRSFDVWRRDRHWWWLALQLRTGRMRRANDLYSADPDLWSPMRREPAMPHIVHRPPGRSASGS
jgi:L-ascorbate metabolism protein UlaG (beta-lactamase superfamily)